MYSFYCKKKERGKKRMNKENHKTKRKGKKGKESEI